MWLPLTVVSVNTAVAGLVMVMLMIVSNITSSIISSYLLEMIEWLLFSLFIFPKGLHFLIRFYHACIVTILFALVQVAW